jgi:hypothetical protein
VVTTKWRKEAEQMKGLITKLLNETNTADADKLIALSDEAINFVVIQALTEPENVDQIKVLEGSKRSKSL